MFKKTVRDKNVRDGSADNAIFKRKSISIILFLKLLTLETLKIAKVTIDFLFHSSSLASKERTRSSCDL